AGGSSLNVCAITSLSDTNVNVSGGGILNFCALTALTRVNLSASGGGKLLFPAAATYANGATANYTIQASGAGSKIDLSHLTAMAGSNSCCGILAITAGTGGEIDLAGAITGYTSLTVSDAASVLNVGAVTGLSDANVTG